MATQVAYQYLEVIRPDADSLNGESLRVFKVSDWGAENGFLWMAIHPSEVPELCGRGEPCLQLAEWISLSEIKALKILSAGYKDEEGKQGQDHG